MVVALAFRADELADRCRAIRTVLSKFTEHDIGVRIPEPLTIVAARILRETAGRAEVFDCELGSKTSQRELCLDLQSAPATCARRQAHP